MKILVLIVLLFISQLTTAQNLHPHAHRLRPAPTQDWDQGAQVTAELNFFNGYTTSNIFLEFETESHVTIGAYFLNMPVDTGTYAKNNTRDAYFSIVKQWQINQRVYATAGTQFGTYLSAADQHLLNFSYLQAEALVIHNMAVTVGTFFANKALSETSNYVGAIVGAKIWLDKAVWLEANWLSGTTASSGTTVNLFWQTDPLTKIYIGVQNSNSNQAESAAIVGVDVKF